MSSIGDLIGISSTKIKNFRVVVMITEKRAVEVFQFKKFFDKDRLQKLVSAYNQKQPLSFNKNYFYISSMA